MKNKMKMVLIVSLSLSFLFMVPKAFYAGKRYVDNGDGTISDYATGLIGLKNANCFGKRKWRGAMSVVSRLSHGSCGLTDGSRPGHWRLPIKDELPTLFSWTGSGAFSRARAYIYWSGVSYDAKNAWYVHLNLGDVGIFDKLSGYYVWPVRSMR